MKNNKIQSKNKRLLKPLLYCAILTTLLTPMQTFANGMTSEIVTIGESMQQSQSTTIVLPSSSHVTSVTTNTGNVSYSKSGNNLTLNVSNGTPSRTVYNAQKYSKTASDYTLSSTNSFASTKSYSDADGYAGNLSKNGSSYLHSGSYTPSQSRTESTYRYTSPGASTSTLPSSVPYNSGGYSGTLYPSGSPIVDSGYSPDSRTETAYRTTSPGGSTGGMPTSVYYDSGGYTGNLYPGSPYLISGEAGGSFTATTSREGVQRTSTSIFPTSIPYNSNGYTGTLTKSGGWNREIPRYESTSTTKLQKTWNETDPIVPPESEGAGIGTWYQDWRTYMHKVWFRYKWTKSASWRADDGYMKSGASDQNRWTRGWWSGNVYGCGTVSGQTYSSSDILRCATSSYYTHDAAENHHDGLYRWYYSYISQNYAGTVTKPDTRVYERKYTGTVTRPDSRVWEQYYTGSVSTPATDTRVYRQDYSGTVYKSGNDTYYKYTVTVNYGVDTTPPDGTISATPTGWTNGNVTINLTNVQDVGTSGLKHVRLPNGSYATGGSFSHVATSNGTYTFTLEDNIGNTSTKSYTVSNIDKNAPSGNLSQTPTSWTNGNVTLNLSAVADTGGAGLKHIKLPNGTLVTGTSAIHSVSSNGTYTFEIHDNAGNVTTRSITVSNIEKTAPTATLTQTPTGWTNGNVTLNLSSISDSQSGVKHVTLPNGTVTTPSGSSVSQTVTANGLYTFKVEDNAGNVSNHSISVANIDKTNSIATLTQTPTSWTNGNVTLNLNGIADNESGVKHILLPDRATFVNGSAVSHIVSSNGSYTFTVYDNAGNTTNKTINVTNIDKTSPTASLTQSTTAWTNGTVRLTLSGITDTGSGVKEIELPNGSKMTASSEAIYDVTSNGTYSFKVSDNAGNSITRTITVSNIERTVPVISLSPNGISWTNASPSVSISISDAGGSGFKSWKYRQSSNNGSTYGSWSVDNPSNTGTISVNSTGIHRLQIEAVDRAGNTVSLTTNPYYVDKVNPLGTISANTTSPTNQNVTLTLSSSDADSGVKQVTTPSGNVISGSSATYVVSANGTFSFSVQDNAGNIQTVSYTVSNIDKISPTGNLTQTPTTPTNGNVSLSLTGVADTGGSGLRATNTIKLPNGTFANGTSASYSISSNGVYSFEIYDNAGNVEVKSIAVSNIDKQEPVGIVSQTPVTPTNGNVTLMLRSLSDTGGAGLDSVILPNGTVSGAVNQDYVVTANGSYTFRVRDKAGNEKVLTHQVTNIDKLAPTANIRANNTAFTNQNVTLYLENIVDGGGSGLKSVQLPNGTIETTFSNKAFVVSSNGTYDFVIQDNAGNSTVKQITVSNIDKIAPLATIDYSPKTWTNQTVRITLSGISDSGVSGLKQIVLPDGSAVTPSSSTYVDVSANGIYSFTVEDKAGNTTVRSLNIQNIDKEAPDVDISWNTAWTNQDVIISFANARDAGNSGYKSITLPNGVVTTATSGSYTVGNNGVYRFVVEDITGNIKIREITIANIDREKPNVEITEKEATSIDVKANVKVFDK